MDKRVIEIQNWLNKTYTGKKNFIPFAENEIDGIAGVGTYNRLVRALQIEINENYGKNISVDGDFGNGTIAALPKQISKGFSKGNIVRIIQFSLYCKAYETGDFDNIFGRMLTGAIKEFERDAGINDDGVITPIILQGIMNSDPYKYLGESGERAYYLHNSQMKLNGLYGLELGLIAPSGEWERKSQKLLIKSCQKHWGISKPDGLWGNVTKSKAPVITKEKPTDNTNVKLLQIALTVNGFYTGDINGKFDNTVYEAVKTYQDFMLLGADGKVGKGTWASLLTSRGDYTNRKTIAIDTSTRMDINKLNKLKEKGYKTVARYLTNAIVVGGGRDKRITKQELLAFKETGMSLVPIFQTYGNSDDYFGRDNRGVEDAISAKNVSNNYGFPRTATIYFAVDYDVKMDSIEKVIVPYFQDINKTMKNAYKIGVYGPRAVCNVLAEKGLTTSSYVADMSTAFTGNIGQPMPKDWAYDQIEETTIADIGVDRCVESSRKTGFVPSCNFVIYEDNTTNFIDTAHKIKELIIMFETGPTEMTPYSSITGNFDGALLSVGIAQYNLKTGTLQDLFKLMNSKYSDVMSKSLGNYYDEVCRISEIKYSDENLDELKSFGEKYADKTRDEYKALVELCETKEFREMQDNYFDAYIYQAVRRCNKFGFKTARSFAVMLNTAIQCGPGFNDVVVKSLNNIYLTESFSSEKEKLKRFIEVFTNALKGQFKSDATDRCYYLYDESTNPHSIKSFVTSVMDYGVTDQILENMCGDEEANQMIKYLIGHTFF